MGPAQQQARAVADVYAQVAWWVDTYADELGFIKPRLAEAERRAWEFRDRVAGGVQVEAWHQGLFVGAAKWSPEVVAALDCGGTVTVAWDEHAPSVEENEGLLREYANLVEQVSMTAESTAAGIRRASEGSTPIAGATPALASVVGSAGVEVPPPGVVGFLAGVDSGMTPEEVHAAWLSLSVADRAWLTRNRPRRIGNLDGVPYADRDAANRREMNRLLAKVDRARATAAREAEAETGLTGLDLSDSYDQRVNELSGLTDEEIRPLENLRTELGDRSDARLVALDLEHEGATRAAVAIGDLDTAPYTGVFVPGIGSRISDASQLNGYLDRMDSLRDETGEVLEDVGAGDKTDVTQVYWLGYSAPAGVGLNVGPAVLRNRAAEGGDRLAGFADGMEAVNPGARKTLLGHSYGSVTSAYAAGQTEAFDSFVAFGSPGMREDVEASAATGYNGVLDLNVDPDQRYYGLAHGDGVGVSRAHGLSPGDWDFGRLPTREIGEYTNSTGHSQYLDPGTSFQRSAAAIVAGHPEKVPQ